MTLEAGKEMDRRCVWNWLNDVYRNPTVAYNTYSDEQQIEFAHDILVLLKKQEPSEAIEITNNFYPIGDPLRTIGWKCGQCGKRIACYDNYCPDCGKAVKWDETK